jgi:hypothetical protein
MKILFEDEIFLILVGFHLHPGTVVPIYTGCLHVVLNVLSCVALTLHIRVLFWGTRIVQEETTKFTSKIRNIEFEATPSSLWIDVPRFEVDSMIDFLTTKKSQGKKIIQWRKRRKKRKKGNRKN